MRFISLTLTVFMIYGCSSKKMMVQSADVFVENQIEKRLPLYSAQKQALAKDVKMFLNQQKPLTKEAIKLIRVMELDPRKVDVQYDHLERLYHNLTSHFSQLISRYLAPLDEKQRRDFLENIRSENTKMAKIGPGDYMEKIQDNFENLFGTISDRQRHLLEEQEEYINERYKNRLQRRSNLLAEFEEIYKLDISSEARVKYFKNAFNNYQQHYADVAKDKIILKQLIPTLSDEQKKIFRHHVEQLKEILNLFLETDY